MKTKPTPTAKLRERYLQRATSVMRAAWAKRGIAVPADVQVTCGFPGGGSPNKRIGECWPRGRSAHGVNEVMINPVLDATAQVLDVLGHELLHAVDDCKSMHGHAFSRNSRMVGYSGGKHSSAETPEAKALIAQIEKRLGAYPHGAVVLVKKQQKENTGLHGCECGCGNKIYITAKKFDEFGAPVCGACGEEMLPGERTTKKTVTTI